MAEKVTVTVKTERTLLLPTMPNFIRDEQNAAIPIESLSQEQLRELGQKWTEALLRKARDRAGSKIADMNKRLQKLGGDA